MLSNSKETNAYLNIELFKLLILSLFQKKIPVLSVVYLIIV